jgi:drug/metabolite transporter, DME family
MMPQSLHLLALGGALFSALATIWIRQGLRASDPYTGFFVNVVVGTVSLWIAVIATGGLGHVSARGALFFMCAGLIGTVGGRLLRFVAIEKVGASIAAALINLNPFVSTALAIALLGESITVPIVIGTVVIVAGTTLLSLGGKRLGFRPGLLALPILSAVCFGVVAVLRKLGLSDTSAVVGSAINVTTALVAYTAFLLASGRPEVMVCRGRSLVYFAAAGLAENVGVFMNVVALGMGRVSVVTPLYGTAPLFVLVLAPFFLRNVERLTARVVAGTLLIVFGVYLITLLSGR